MATRRLPEGTGVATTGDIGPAGRNSHRHDWREAAAGKECTPPPEKYTPPPEAVGLLTDLDAMPAEEAGLLGDFSAVPAEDVGLLGSLGAVSTEDPG